VCFVQSEGWVFIGKPTVTSGFYHPTFRAPLQPIPKQRKAIDTTIGGASVAKTEGYTKALVKSKLKSASLVVY